MTMLTVDLERSAVGMIADRPVGVIRREGVLCHRLSLIVVGLLAVSAFAPTLLQRGHYSDDFPNRMAVQTYGWTGACTHYRESVGWIRPIGYAAVMLSQWAFWDQPWVQQSGLLGFWVVLCVLLSVLVTRLCNDRGAGLAAGAMLAVWPASTSVVAWVAAGAQMLPAYVLLLWSLIVFAKFLDTGRTRCWIIAQIVFAVSILFHDQHLGAAAAFTAIGVLYSSRGRRVRGALATIPFWIASAVVAAVALSTTQGSDRPLNPTAWGVVVGLSSYVVRFIELGVITPIRHGLMGAGPAESLSRMAYRDAAALVASVIVMLGGVGILWLKLTRAASNRQDLPRRLAPAVIGMVIVLAGLGIMAANPAGALQPRHSVLPAIGLAMLVASVVGVLREGRIGRRVVPTAFAIVVTVLGMLQVGYAYEWATRTRVTDRVIAELDRLCPAPAEGELMVIDGLLHYGRGFNDSWGLSSAMTLRHGVRLRVATKVRRQDGRLYANAAWDKPWLIDAANTRRYRWDDEHESLEVVRLDRSSQ